MKKVITILYSLHNQLNQSLVALQRLHSFLQRLGREFSTSKPRRIKQTVSQNIFLQTVRPRRQLWAARMNYCLHFRYYRANFLKHHIYIKCGFDSPASPSNEGARHANEE